MWSHVVCHPRTRACNLAMRVTYMEDERVVPMPGQEPDENHGHGEEEFKKVLDKVEPEPGGAEQDDVLAFRRDAPLNDRIRSVVTHSRHRRRSKQNLMAKKDAHNTDITVNQDNTRQIVRKTYRRPPKTRQTALRHLHQLQHKGCGEVRWILNGLALPVVYQCHAIASRATSGGDIHTGVEMSQGDI